MKKLVCIAMILLLVAGGCKWFEGDKGDPGLTGSSGQDAVISTKIYTASTTGAGNPAALTTPEVSLSAVESGRQTVDIYMYSAEVDEWLPLPCSLETGGDHIDHFVMIGEGYIRYESYKNSALISPDALYGRDTMVIVKNFNR